ncbi:MAG: hypothetical protein HYT76_01530 [Deltaproteobacteria bacterium]|nr:hypothetical protein [Deltaproteobacteria bacterium]
MFRFRMLILVVLVSCGDITVNERTPLTPGESLSSGDIAVVLGADWQGTTGSISMIPLDSPSSVVANLEITHSDAVVRSFGGLIYVVNRKGADNIQVIDPIDFSTISQISTGLGTNPQDLVAVSKTKAYVTLYEPEENQSTDLSVDDLVILNPETGLIEKTIDLTLYTGDDGERFARASSLLLMGSKLYVAVQDLPRDLALQPDQPGKLVKVDTTTDEVEGALVLDCWDPFDITSSDRLGKIYIACADFFDLNSPYGGVEVVDLETFQSEGILLSDESFGGWIGGIEVGDHYGFVIVGLSDYSENRLVRFSLDDPKNLKTLYESSSYLPEVAIDPRGEVLICDRDPDKNGIVFIDPESAEVIAGPISVGFPPASVTFVERKR